MSYRGCETLRHPKSNAIESPQSVIKEHVKYVPCLVLGFLLSAEALRCPKSNAVEFPQSVIKEKW